MNLLTDPNTSLPVPPFVAFPKIPRLRRDIVITEKIDGTNAQVVVLEDGRVLAGSRNRWITPEKDNFGFAAWVKEHEDDLRTGLGVGTHFGEWWGQGIQRGYGLDEKRFSLFNVKRWGSHNPPPGCCSVVPKLYAGPETLPDGYVSPEAAEKYSLPKEGSAIDYRIAFLRVFGSMAAPGFMRPEGIVVFHTAGGHMYKVTLENDESPKGQVAAE